MTKTKVILNTLGELERELRYAREAFEKAYFMNRPWARMEILAEDIADAKHAYLVAKEEYAALDKKVVKKPLKHFYIGGPGWFVVRCKNLTEAKTMGIQEYGRRGLIVVREATANEIAAYINQRGEEAMTL